MVHVGVDLHKRVSQIAVLTAEGELTQHRLVNDVGRVEQFFAQLPTPAPVAIEASGTWWWLVDLLESLGHQPVLSHPKQTKAIAAARLKNDRVDAERLVLLLRGDLLPKVWIPPRELREARELLRHRVSLVWTRTEIKNRLLALLARRNLQPTGGTSWFTARGQRALQALPLGPVPGTIREDCVALLHLLDEQIRRLDQELVDRWGEDLRVRRLMTVLTTGAQHGLPTGRSSSKARGTNSGTFSEAAHRSPGGGRVVAHIPGARPRLSGSRLVAVGLIGLFSLGAACQELALRLGELARSGRETTPSQPPQLEAVAEEVQITTDPSPELWPRISPDGNWLVFTSQKTGNFELYFLQLSNPRLQHQMTASSGHKCRATTNPNGRFSCSIR